MVLESVVADLLNRLLCKYVENVNQTQVRVGIWSGDVTLENLKFREDALDELDLPVKVRFAHLGQLVLKIPWKNLYTAPLVISLERLFLLAVPNRDIRYDPAKEELWEKNAKEYELQKIEEIKKQAQQTTEVEVDETFIEKLAAQVMKNIQIKISDIHIRYEDRMTNNKNPFSVGVTLSHFHAYSANKFWIKTVIEEGVEKVNKVVNVESFAIYWNCNSPLFSQKFMDKKLPILPELQKTICSKNRLPAGFNYLLEPIHLTIRMLINSKPELDHYKIPKFDVDIEIETLALCLDKQQYCDIIRLIESFNRMTLCAPYRKYRPYLNRYRGHYVEWWKFAYTCILEEDIRRIRRNWNWNHMKHHIQKCRTYAVVYRNLLVTRQPTAKVIAKVKELETDMDVFNIILIRERVEMEIKNTDVLQPNAKPRVGWDTWAKSFFFRSSHEQMDVEESGSLINALGNAMTPNEKEKLYQAIGYQEHSTPTVYPLSYIAVLIQFNLSTLQLVVKDKSIFKYNILHLAFTKFSVHLEQRPTRNGLKINANIFRFFVHGLKQKNIIPLLIASKNVLKNENLLDIYFELNPLHSPCDQRIIVFLRSLQLVYDLHTIQKVFDLFQGPMDSDTLYKLQAQLVNVKEMSATGLQYAIDQHAAMELKLDIKAPYIIIPHRGFYTFNEDILVVNLGSLKITSFPRNPASDNVRSMYKKGISEQTIFKTMISQSYDKFFCNFENIQILMVLNGENWLEVLEKNEVTPLHFLEPLSFVIIVNNCLIRDDPKLPKLKISMSIKNITINLTNLRLAHLLSIISSIPSENKVTGRTGSKDKEIHIAQDSVPHLATNYLISAYLETKVERTKKNKVIKEKHVQDFKDKIQSILCDMSFELGSVFVKVFLVATAALSFETTKQFLTLTLLKMEADAIQKTFDLSVTARLGGISLDVFDFNKPVGLLSTPTMDSESNNDENDYLFIINYYQLDTNAPEFILKDNVRRRQLKIGFSVLKMTIHQEVLLSFVDVVRNFQFQLDKLIKNCNDIDKLKETTKYRLRDAQKKVVEQIRERKVARRLKEEQVQVGESSEEISIDLKANIQQIEILVETRTTPIVNLQISGCLINITSCASLSKLLFQLKKIQIFDCCSKSIHYEILTTVGDEACDIEIVTYNKSKLFSHVTSDTPDMSVKAKIACLRVIYLNRFVSSLMVFYSNVEIIQSLLIVPTSEHHSNPDENISHVVGDPTFARIDIKMDSPIIILPLNSLSMEAVMVYCGLLTISNRCLILSEFNANEVPASLDCIKIKLETIKANRVNLDENYQVLYSITIIDPFCVDVEIERNLTLWYKCVSNLNILARIPCLNVFCTEGDYKMFMKVVKQNFAETPDVSLNEVEVYEKPERCADSISPKLLATTNFDETSSSEMTPSITAEPDKVIQNIKIVFDGVVLQMFTGGAVSLSTELAELKKEFLRISLLSFYLGLVKHLSGSETCEFFLQNCVMDDLRRQSTRHKNNHNVTFMQLNESFVPLNDEYDQDKQSCDFHEGKLITVFYLRNSDGTFVDILIQSFQLILCLEYLMELKDVFMSYTPDPEVTSILKTDCNLQNSNYSTKVLKEKSIMNVQKQLQNTPIQIKLKTVKPNVIIVETYDNPCNNALVFEGDVLFKMQFVGITTSVCANIENFQLNQSCFKLTEKPNTMRIVLHPCTLTFIGSFITQSSLQLEVSLTDITISISSITIDLLYKVNTTIQSFIFGDKVPSNENVDYSDVWTPKRITLSEFSFFNETSLQETPLNKQSFEEENLNMKEVCTILAPIIIISLESGSSKNREPIILIEISLESVVYDWSSRLYIYNNLSLQIAYYNSNLALWEPLLEPIESNSDGKYTYQPWELAVILQMNRVIPTSTTEFDKISQEHITQNVALHIAISSKDKMELTLTKTGMGVLTRLGTFMDEVDSNPVYEGVVSPYVVSNMSGIPITLILHEGPFKMLRDHDVTIHHEVTVESGSQVELVIQEEEFINILQARPPQSATTIASQGTYMKKFLNISARYNARTCVLAIPTFRADKRYFSLKFLDENGDQWGLVSDVTITGGSTLITLRSIIKVKNHFKVSIQVYCKQNIGEGLVCCGTIEPDNEVILPILCIYTAVKEFMFCTDGYKLSGSFTWTNLQNARVISNLLQCFPIDSKQGDSVFLKVVGYSSSLTFENTSHYTPESVAYVINLYPLVTLKNLLPVNVTVLLGHPKHQSSQLLKAGDQLQMIHVKPKEGNIYVEIPNYCGQRWTSGSHIDWISQFSVIKFSSEMLDEEKSLELHIFNEDVDGMICLHIYSPFWMLNKTGFSLHYRQFDNQKNVCYHNYDVKEPMMFSYWGKATAKNTVSVMVTGGQWSEKFSLDAAGSSGIVSCTMNAVVYQIGVKIQLSTSKLTKHVIFEPFYVLINNHKMSIKCQEVDLPEDPWILLEPGDCLPFWPRAPQTNSSQSKIHVCFTSSSKISSSFEYNVVQSILLKMDTHGGVFVDVHKVEAAVYITFLPYKPGLAPALLMNHTNKPICFYEDDHAERTLNTQEMLIFTWQEPTEAKKITYVLEHGMEFSDSLQNDCFKEFKCKTRPAIYWVSFLEGLQRISLFTNSNNIALRAQLSCKLEPIDMEISVTLHHVGISLVNNITMKELMYINIASSDGTEQNKFKPLSVSKHKIFKRDLLNYKHVRRTGRLTNNVINISSDFEICQESKQQLPPLRLSMCRSYSEGLWFVMKTSQHQSIMHGKLSRVQIDNQLVDRVFPVMFAPEPLPRTVRRRLEKKPFAELLIVRRYMENNQIKHYKHFKVLIQEFNVKLDMNTLSEISEFLDSGVLSKDEEALQFQQDLKLASEPLLTTVYKSALMEEKSFYELFHVSPLKLHVSFSLSSDDQPMLETGTHNFLLIFLHDIGVTLTDIDNVVLKLNYFEQKNTFSTNKQMYSCVFSHYVNEFLKNAYAVIFGLNLFGNPLGLLRGLGKGVQDLFYEPYLGAVQGPQAFGQGVMLGVLSLVGSAVGGMCGAIARISATVGTGIAVLTFDRDFQRDRMKSKRRIQPGTRGRLIRGTKRLVWGVVDGVSGVLTQPAKGARRGGVVGFLRGVGKGVVGLVTKPVVGVCDFVSESLSIVPTGVVTRPLRPPRFLRGDGLVRPYSRVEADGNLLLHELDKGRFLATDNCTYLLAGFNDTRDRLLLTDKRIMYIQEDKILGIVLLWEYTWDLIESVIVNSDGVSLTATQTQRRSVISRRLQKGEELIAIKNSKLRTVLRSVIMKHLELYHYPGTNI